MRTATPRAPRTGDGPATGRRTAAGRRTAGRRRRVLVVAGLLVPVVLAGGAGLGEAAARRVLHDRVLAAAPALGDGATVGAGGDPVLWDVARRRIPHLEIGSDEARYGRLPRISVRARLDDVRLGGTTRVGGSRVEVTVPLASVGAAVQAAVPTVAVGAVTADPASGEIEVALGRGGLGKVTMRPVITDGRVSLPVTSATVLGRPVAPENLSRFGGLGAGQADGRATGPANRLGLTADTLRLQPDALHITLTGGPATLPDS
ncbi:LmeA family phospholipid-binding protein [Kitasatospora camelliae]|uniref:LmeA family phospholipid-binding protein n=1 Tax=Kitasatospora camelliae TaxID=3156397 RepID=A0AAU8K484_9ACTN